MFVAKRKTLINFVNIFKSWHEKLEREQFDKDY